MAYIDRYNPHKWKIFGVLNKFLERKGVVRPLCLRTITTNINNVSNKCMSFKMPNRGHIIYIKKITSFLTELIQSLKKSINSSAKKISLSSCFQADIWDFFLEAYHLGCEYTLYQGFSVESRLLDLNYLIWFELPILQRLDQSLERCKKREKYYFFSF